MKDGLYEQVINKGLDSELASTDKLSQTAPIDTAEASKVLAKYVAEVVERGLDNLRDNGGDLNAQVALANQIITTIQAETKEADFDSLSVAERAEQLLALFDRQNSIWALDEKAQVVRPETSIAQSSLFTGAVHEPQIYTEACFQNQAPCTISDMLYCADCGKKLWFETNTINRDIHFFSCSNYEKDHRGNCKTRHYIRADSLEQIVMLELRQIAEYLRVDEEGFAELLAQKTQKDLLAEKRQTEAELQKALARNDTVLKLYEKVYEDNAEGKVSDEWFMQLSHKYEVEKLELKSRIASLRTKLTDMDNQEMGRENYMAAIRKFMEMDTLTAPLLRELIDHITVYETEGTGKNRTQRVVIHYNFVGYMELPDNTFKRNFKADTRQGVRIEYLRDPTPA